MTPAKAPLPFLGTWKLTSCETSHPDLPHPTTGIATFTQKDDGIHYTNEGVWSDGRTSKVSAVLQMDGSWCPISDSLVADSISFRQLDDYAGEARMKKGGADVGITRSLISADGRTMSGHWELLGPGGVAVTWKTTSERQ